VYHLRDFSFQVSKDGAKIRRKTPMPATDEELIPRTIYCKGLKEDDFEVTTQIFTPFGKVEGVRHRRYKKGNEWIFKTSAFVVFSTVEEAEAVLAAEKVHAPTLNRHLDLVCPVWSCDDTFLKTPTYSFPMGF
jgi:hypothetical protein